ncbi:OmpA family protein [Porifericola rhodea]|uniref:OmpA family protein n=1 Tax=Porifericola rhodea TaxID=930972 RepID=UPI00266673E3|nr:OmpA family protein [Porifericola rhodea]WKN30418.1 OmpA family protein [Porifericola rhodea]
MRVRSLFIILGLVFLQLTAVYAQSNYAYKRAYKLYYKYAFANAIEAYSDIYRESPADSICIRIAECYTKLNQPQHTANWYAKVKHTDTLSADHYLAYGRALESLGQYADALLWYQKCARANPDDSRIPYKIKGIEQQETYFKDSARLKISNLNVNTRAYEFAPAYFQKGIVFASSRPREGRSASNYKWDNTPFLDIYYAPYYRGGRFMELIPFDNAINSSMHEGAMSFNNNYTRIIFTRNNYFEHKKGRSEQRVNKLKMYMAERDSDNKEDKPPYSWKNIEEFPFNSDQYSVGDPSSNASFTQIIFTSDMPGSLGGTDLFVTYYKHGQWSTPENLGPDFNTEGNERTPFLHEDGRIFFASDGRDGLGGLDIYVATPTNNGYTVRNMGYPINSPRDDFGLIIDKAAKSGYFSSNREESLGLDDIYAFSIQEIPEAEKQEIQLNVCIEVREKDTDSLMANVSVHMMNVEAGSSRTFTTDENGQLCTQLRPEQEYVIKAEKATFLSDCFRMQTQYAEHTDLKAAHPLYLEKLKVEQKFTYENVYFDLDDFSIREDAAAELDKIVAFIKSHPGILVELSSHTDSRATNMYNEALSLKRAKSSREYIISQGIAPEVITAKGYGEYMLVNDCNDGVPCTEEQHQQNRRTEIRITGIQKSNKAQTKAAPLDPKKDYTEDCTEVPLIPQSQISYK